MNSENSATLDKLNGFLSATMMCLSNYTLGKHTQEACAILIEKNDNIMDSMTAHFCFEDKLISVSDFQITQIETQVTSLIHWEKSIQKKLPTASEKQRRLAWHIVDMLEILTEDINVLSVSEYRISDIISFHNQTLKYKTDSHLFVVEIANELIVLCFSERTYLSD